MTARTRVCVYGVRTAEDGLAAAAGGADAVAFMFTPSSTRYVRPEDAWEIAQRLPPFVSTIGVFTNATVEQFCAMEETCPTDYSQLHGEEGEEVVRQCGPRVIKTIKADPQTLDADMVRWNQVDEVDAVLVTVGPESGVTWDDVHRTAAKCARPVLIGGGLTVHNVGEAVRTVRPWGLAVREAVELEDDDGTATIEEHLVAHFCSAARKADRQ